MQCSSLHNQNSVNLLSTVRVLNFDLFFQHKTHTHTHTHRLNMTHTTKSITQKAGKTYNKVFFCLQGHPSNSWNSFNPEVQFNVSSSTNKSIQVPNKSPNSGFRMQMRKAAIIQTPGNCLGAVVSTTKEAIFLSIFQRTINCFIQKIKLEAKNETNNMCQRLIFKGLEL